MKSFCLTLAPAALLLCHTAAALAAPNSIPWATGTALDGHTVTLPHDLSGGATIIILGFSQRSADSTTAWEVPVRTSLATSSSVLSDQAIRFFDMPFLEDAPSLIRPLIVRSIRKQVPDAVRPNFVPLTSGEHAWKQIAGFSPDAPDAAYVLLVDRSGNVLWQTHEAFSQARFEQLAEAARRLAAGRN
jgi:hypothetical protein